MQDRQGLCQRFLPGGTSPTPAVPHSVEQKAANAWGLYDMAGNVWEYVHDGYEAHLSAATDPVGSFKSNVMKRGGCCGTGAKDSRAAERKGASPLLRHSCFDLPPLAAIWPGKSASASMS